VEALSRSVKPVLLKKDLFALGYQKLEHGGYVWQANEEVARLIEGVDDWSPSGLAGKRGWTFWEKRRHELYLVQTHSGKYLVKTYPPKENQNHAWFYSQGISRAEKEFRSSVAAYKRGIPTPLPSAIGGKKGDRRWGIIIYPFLDETVGLDRVYADERLNELSVRDRQHVEKAVGRLLRKFIDQGMYPRYLKLDHFLIRRENERLVVYWIDLERTKFTYLFKRMRLLKTIGKFLATMEWFRVSGARVNRPSMFRIGDAFFRADGSKRSDKKLHRAAIQAAEEFWHRRHLYKKKPPTITVIEPLITE
jgi:hypothetical protein